MSPDDQRPVADTDAYLRAVGDRLDFLDEVRREVLDELRTHIEDTARELRDDGVEPTDAVRRALQRLGPPEELARDIRKAHQTTRRALAAAGGGVISAAGEGFLALVVAALSTLPVSIIAGSLVRLDPVQELAVPVESPWSTVLRALGLCLGAFVAGSVLPWVLALRGHRSLSWGRRWAGALGAVVAALVALAAIRGSHNWASVVTLLSVPAWFAFGVLTAEEATRPRRLLGARYVGATLVVVAASSVAWLMGAEIDDFRADRETPEWTRSSLNLDRVAPLDRSSLERVLGMREQCCPRQFVTYFGEGGPPEGYRDHRFEAWASLPDAAGIDADVPGPIAIDVARREVDQSSGETGDDEYVGELDPTGYRSLPNGAWVVFTATRADGQRVVLGAPRFARFAFHGSALDWLRARELPVPSAEQDEEPPRATQDPARLAELRKLLGFPFEDCFDQGSIPADGHILAELDCDPLGLPATVTYTWYRDGAALDASVAEDLDAIGRSDIAPGHCPGSGPGLGRWAGGRIVCAPDDDLEHESIEITWTHDRLRIAARVTVIPESEGELARVFAARPRILPAP